MKKTFSLLLLFSFLQVAFATTGFSTFVYTSPNPDPTDTVPDNFNKEVLLTFSDSAASEYSASDIYGEFDTENIHYTKFKVESLKDSIKTIVLNDKNSCGYVPPVLGKINCPFGRCRRYFHYGMDLHLQTGDAVGAAFDGKVRIAKKSKSYGNVVVIRHSNGLETYYAHLSKLNVQVGQEVSAGDIIGLGGNTGWSHGSHLHFEVRYLGQPINPADIISFDEHKLVSDTLMLSKKTFSYAAKNYNKGLAKNYNSKTNVVNQNAGKLTGNVYVVKQGDSLYIIARKYGTSVSVLCQKNGLSTNSVLHLGQKLKI